MNTLPEPEGALGRQRPVLGVGEAQVTPRPWEAGLLGKGAWPEWQILELLTCAPSLARGPATPTLPLSRATEARRSLEIPRRRRSPLKDHCPVSPKVRQWGKTILSPRCCHMSSHTGTQACPRPLWAKYGTEGR